MGQSGRSKEWTVEKVDGSKDLKWTVDGPEIEK